VRTPVPRAHEPRTRPPRSCVVLELRRAGTVHYKPRAIKYQIRQMVAQGGGAIVNALPVDGGLTVP